MDGDTFVFQRRADLGSSRGMFNQQIMYAVGAQVRASGIGKQNLSVTARLLVQPAFQHSHCWFGKRHTPFFPAFPNHMDMGTYAEYDIIACQPGHFG